MSEGNGDGILRLGRHGRRKMQYADDKGPDGKPLYPVVEVDIIHVSNKWHEIDQSFRGEDGKVPPERMAERSLTAMMLACEVLQVPPRDAAGNPTLSLTDALHFIKVITEEAVKLMDFFVVKPSGEPSSPRSTTVTYSQ